jgi:hypothetical protein
MANENKSLILTEDKDFGERVFSYRIKLTGVTFLRYQKIDFQDMINSRIFVLENTKKHDTVNLPPSQKIKCELEKFNTLLLLYCSVNLFIPETADDLEILRKAGLVR